MRGKLVNLLLCLLMVITSFVFLSPNATAENNRPVADANGPYSAYVGMEVILIATGSYDQDEGDTLEYYWDFDNNGVWDSGPLTIPIEKHIWNNEYQGEVVVLVTDGELNDTASANVSIVALVVDAGIDRNINEGEETEFLGTITPNIPVDITAIWTFEPSVVWPPPYKDNKTYCKRLPVLVLDKVTYGSVNLECTLRTYHYVVHDLHLIALNGTFTDVDIQVPHVVTLSTPTAFGCIFSPPRADNTSFKVNITMEPDSDDVWRVQWHISDNTGNVSWNVMSNRTGLPIPFNKSHGDDCGRPYHTVNLTIRAGDFIIGWDTIILNISNVAPTVIAGSDLVVNVGDTIHFNGSFSDPGWLDSHTITWNFGDGTNKTGSLSPTHMYEKEGTYTVTLYVEDDDGGIGSDTFTVIVKEEENGDFPPYLILIITLVLIIVIILSIYILSKKRGTIQE